MVLVDSGAGSLDCRLLSLFYARDPWMGYSPVAIFHGPSTTTNSTQNSSRIQAHIFSTAGYQSFPRLTISPTSPLYSAVHQLPPEEQGDEICRGLAICLFKYFSEITHTVKERISDLSAMSATGSTPPLFSSQHAANLASEMALAENSSSVAKHLLNSLGPRSISWLDIDVILPAKAIKKLDSSHSSLGPAGSWSENGKGSIDYGKFAEMVELLGTPSFLPTSKLRRAPSRPTAGSKSRVLTQEQKESLHREMRELFETEKSYVSRINQLTRSAAVEFSRNETRNTARSPRTRALNQLFPATLIEIEDINTEFLNQIGDLLGNSGKNDIWITERDPTGADAFAKLLLQYFPRFKEPYQAYLRASTQFSTILSNLLRENSSDFLRAVHQSGEQRLRSWLIEPVQRLPRYSLFIENMVTQLPADHPAMPKFLRAKDTIADICALDEDDVGDNARLIQNLKNLVADWPAELVPEGRLVTAADVTELDAPYLVRGMRREAQNLLLLFSDYVLVVRRLASNALSARGLKAELDRPISTTASISPNSQGRLLSLTHLFPLRHTVFTESNEGSLIHLAHVAKASRNRRAPTAGTIEQTEYSASTRVFLLQGSYEGKAARWSEEVARARIEHRFPEPVREDERWSLRACSLDKEGLGIISAIFADETSDSRATRRRPHARTRIVLEHEDQVEARSAWDIEDEDVEILGRVFISASHKCRLDFKYGGESTTLDNIETNEFASVFTKHLGSLLRLRQQPKTYQTATSFVSDNQKIAETLQPSLPADQTQTRKKFGPMSPVKALSSFLGGISRDQASLTRLPIVRTDSTMQKATASSTPYKPSRFTAQAQFISETKGSNSIDESKAAPTLLDSTFVQLENTLSTYIVALHSRCGNVVGKVIRNRANADILAVNELYNALLGDPNQYQSTAEVPIDVLFSAFEKFLNHEWRERIGPVLPRQILERMQKLFDTKPPNLIQQPLKDLVNELNPQNQRAFSALIRLLYELLEASGNDGDRGALTAAFTEAMIQEGDPLQSIPLLDRLVENIDVLFDDLGPLDTNSSSKSNSWQSTRATNTGSLSSTASSLKKRFGFGNLTRENSKIESESRVGQILRNLSKKSSAEANSQPSSLSKSFLNRSRSTDNENRRPMLSRPGSKDSNQALSALTQPLRPVTANQSVPEPTVTRPTIRAAAPETPRRKRRSSLSDLTNLRNSPIPDFASPNRHRKADIPADAISPAQTARRILRTPSPAKMQRATGEVATKIPSPTNLKENMPPKAAGIIREPLIKQSGDTHPGSGFSPKKRGAAPTQIPSMKAGVLSPNAVSGSPRKTSSPQKLKIQSPQKLRERLDREKKAIEEAGPSLQLELLKIGEELSPSKSTGVVLSQQTKDLMSRMQGLESRMASFVNDLSKRTTSLQADIDSSLAVSEKKARSLDELYREANAENELLYEKFNTELARMLKSVKEGEGVREMSAKLKEAQEEASRLRKENQRLKRENLGLRSQLKGV